MLVNCRKKQLMPLFIVDTLRIFGNYTIFEQISFQIHSIYAVQTQQKTSSVSIKYRACVRACVHRNKIKFVFV